MFLGHQFLRYDLGYRTFPSMGTPTVHYRPNQYLGQYSNNICTSCHYIPSPPRTNHKASCQQRNRWMGLPIVPFHRHGNSRRILHMSHTATSQVAICSRSRRSTNSWKGMPPALPYRTVNYHIAIPNTKGIVKQIASLL